jgi:hypothetical protein
LNLTAANASDAKTQLNTKARAMNRLFTSTPQCFSSNPRHRTTQVMQKHGALPVKFREQTYTNLDCGVATLNFGGRSSFYSALGSGWLATHHGYAFMSPRSAGV